MTCVTFSGGGVFSPEWFLVAAVGLMKDLGHGQDDDPRGESWLLPKGLEIGRAHV